MYSKYFLVSKNIESEFRIQLNQKALHIVKNTKSSTCRDNKLQMKTTKEIWMCIDATDKDTYETANFPKKGSICAAELNMI